MEIDHGPAARGDICQGHKNPEFDYPERFGGKVPKTVKLRRRVSADFPIRMLKPDCVAERGGIYPAWTNRHGAVSAILPNGERLGLKPWEFDVHEWI